MVDAATDGVAGQHSMCQRCTGMWAFVGQGEEAALQVEKTDHGIGDNKHSSFTTGNVVYLADRLKYR